MTNVGTITSNYLEFGGPHRGPTNFLTRNTCLATVKCHIVSILVKIDDFGIRYLLASSLMRERIKCILQSYSLCRPCITHAYLNSGSNYEVYL